MYSIKIYSCWAGQMAQLRTQVWFLAPKPVSSQSSVAPLPCLLYFSRWFKTDLQLCIYFWILKTRYRVPFLSQGSQVRSYLMIPDYSVQNKMQPLNEWNHIAESFCKDRSFNTSIVPKYCPCFFFWSTFLYMKSNCENNVAKQSMLARWSAYSHGIQAIVSTSSSSYGKGFGSTKVLLHNAG